jgi:hypothetical protein
LLRTLQAPPRQGSLQESVLLLLLMKLETIEHARFRALSQILIDKDKGQEVFDEYMKIAFPYMEATKTKDKKQALDVLNDWVKGGAFGITPMQQPTMRSKLKTRMVARGRPQTKEEADNLYSKLGSSLPIQ